MQTTYLSGTNAEPEISTTRSDSMSQTVFVRDQTLHGNDTVSDTGTVVIKSSIEIDKERFEATSNGTFIVKTSDPGDNTHVRAINNAAGESLGKIQNRSKKGIFLLIALAGYTDSEYADCYDELLTNSSIDSEFSTPVSEKHIRSVFEQVEHNLMRKYEQLFEEHKKILLKQFNEELHKQLSTLQLSILEDYGKKKVSSFKSPFKNDGSSPLKKNSEPVIAVRNNFNNNIPRTVPVNNHNGVQDQYAKLRRPPTRKLHFSSESETFSATINRK
jgi:hypothetical protein